MRSYFGVCEMDPLTAVRSDTERERENTVWLGTGGEGGEGADVSDGGLVIGISTRGRGLGGAWAHTRYG